jgi:hypothetical protein
MKILVLLLVMDFSLAHSGPLGTGRLEKKENGKPLDPLQRLHEPARFQARAFSHRFSQRRRRNREGANSIMVGAYFIGGPRCQEPQAEIT